MKLVPLCILTIIVCIIMLVKSVTYEEPIEPLVMIYDSGYTAQARTRDGKCLEWTVVYNYPRNITVQMNEIRTIRDFIGQRKRAEIIIGAASQFKDC